MKEIRTELLIEAPPGRVWAALTDVAQFPDWNPFIPRVQGRVRKGAQLEVRITPPAARAMTFRPTVIHLVPERELRWLGRLWVPRLFDGEHIFELHPEADGTRFVQRERFSGLLVPLLWNQMEGPTRSGFITMNEALKTRAETAA